MKLHLSWAACGLLLVLSLAACGGADTLILPDASEVTAVRVTAGGAVTLHTDRSWIEGFLQQAAEAASTGRESTQDVPDQPGAVKVELGTGDPPGWSVLYVYQTEDGCCLEQPYEGIWQGDDALWTQLAADTPPERRNAS